MQDNFTFTSTIFGDELPIEVEATATLPDKVYGYEIEDLTHEVEGNVFIKKDCDKEGDLTLEAIVTKAMCEPISAKQLIKIVENRFKSLDQVLEEEANNYLSDNGSDAFYKGQ